MTIPYDMWRILDDHTVLSLAVVDDAAQPYAALLYYRLGKDDRLYVHSSPATHHAGCMRGTPWVAGTIADVALPIDMARGLQFEARARLVEPGEVEAVRGLYTSVLPVRLRKSPLVERLVEGSFWSLTLTWMKLTDNRLGFGHKEEWGERRTRRPRGGAPG